MTRSWKITFFISFISIVNINAQDSKETDPQPGQLYARIKSISFIKNNEYSNALVLGYTLLGVYFQPEIVYATSPKVTLRAGARILKYSGTGRFSEIRPVFATTFNLSDKSGLTIGSLPGCDKHQLFDPHFDREKLYKAYAEDGFQLTSTGDHIFTDTWLSWENFIFKGDSTREIFTLGESFKYSGQLVKDFLNFEVPVQVQFKHFGGEISSYPEHTETYLNIAAGLRINIDIAQKRSGQAGIEYLWFINNELKGQSPTGIDRGHATWLRLHYTYKALYIGAAYWKAHNFYAPNGNPIYGSISDYQDKVVVPERKIITNFVYLTLLPEVYFKLFAGLETYYDLSSKKLDNSITLHLNFDKLIRLATLRK